MRRTLPRGAVPAFVVAVLPIAAVGAQFGVGGDVSVSAPQDGGAVSEPQARPTIRPAVVDRLHALEAVYAAVRSANPPNARDTVETGLSVAKELQRRGRFGAALQALTDIAALLPPDFTGPLRDDVELTRAVVYRDLDRFADAEAIYRVVLARYDADPKLSRGNRLTIMQDLAELFGSEDRLSDALALSRDVVEGRIALLGANAPLTLSAKSQLASYLSRTGDLVGALALHREVLAARLAATPRDDAAVATSMHNAGAVLDLAKQWDAARTLTAQGIAIRLKLYGDNHPDTIDSWRQLGGIYFSLGDLPKATAVYVRVVNALERIRISATLGDRQRRLFFAKYAQSYKFLALLEAEAGRPSAIAYADAARGRTLGELTSSRAVTDALLTPTDRAALDEASGAVASLASYAPADLLTATPADRAADLDAATARLAQLEARLEQLYPALSFSGRFEPLERSKIRAAIGSGTALLQFIVLGNQVRVLTIGSNDSLRASKLVELPALAETSRAYLALLSAPALANTPADPLVDRAVFAWPDGSYRLRPISAAVPVGASIVSDPAPIRAMLSEKLVAILPPDVRKAPRWVVSSDGPLAGLPLDTLVADGASVAARTQVSYTPSIRTLLTLHDRRAVYAETPRHPLLVVGAPNFSSAPVGSVLRTWQELAGSAAEVRSLTQMFDIEKGTSLFVGAEATERKVRLLDASNSMARFKMIVFSTHGLVDLASPERNAIVLMGDGTSPDNDGYLRAAELTTLHLRADLVVISACQSGVGEWLDGEGAMGLPFALFAAGASSTILTHWSIADASSAAFMSRLFKKIRGGERPVDALWHTKREFATGAAGQKWRDPAYWAAFDFVGAT